MKLKYFYWFVFIVLISGCTFHNNDSVDDWLISHHSTAGITGLKLSGAPFVQDMSIIGIDEDSIFFDALLQRLALPDDPARQADAEIHLVINDSGIAELTFVDNGTHTIEQYRKIPTLTVHCPRSLNIEATANRLHFKGMHGFITAVGDIDSLETIAGCLITPDQDTLKPDQIRHTVVSILQNSIGFKGITLGNLFTDKNRKQFKFINVSIILPLGFAAWLDLERMNTYQLDTAVRINNRIVPSPFSEGLNGALKDERPIIIKAMNTILIQERDVLPEE